ncbi:MAG: cytochrome c biogenesis protein ResB [Sedimentisphaerales bacterium]|nr:cytochrome c biogenesis protein ResB [Sedimentisphaerales bacterium]
MERIKRIILWAGLALIVALIVLSVYSAFIGAERAKEFFNSIPLQIFWSILLLISIVAVIMSPSLLKNTPAAMIHFGIILILTGSIWSSETGHKVQRFICGNNKYPAGRMLVEKGKKQDEMVLDNYTTTVELPFHIGLKDFNIEYYDSGMVKEYISDVGVIQEDEIVAEKKIEVNHPLHFGGYFIYQYDYGEDNGLYTVLKITSDSGLGLIFGGYAFLCIGVFWQLWFKKRLPRWPAASSQWRRANGS